jgi:hypothetical protein
MTGAQTIENSLSVNLSGGAQEFGVGLALAGFDIGGGSAELLVSSGLTAMIGTTTGGASGGIDMTPESGTFTATFDDACTTSPTTTFDYQKIGNVVTIWPVSTAGFPCTSDSANFTTTGAPVPASIRPAIIQGNLIATATDNSVAGRATMGVTAAGNITFNWCAFAAACTATWTNANNKSATALNLTYGLGNP